MYISLYVANWIYLYKVIYYSKDGASTRGSSLSTLLSVNTRHPPSILRSWPFIIELLIRKDTALFRRVNSAKNAESHSLKSLQAQ